MNILNLVLILGSTIASGSAASTAAAVSIKDDRIEYKIDPATDPELVNVFARISFKNDKSSIEFNAEHAKLTTALNTKKRAALAALETEKKGIEEIIEEEDFGMYDYRWKIATLGEGVIDTAKKEWELRSQALGSLTNSGMISASSIAIPVKQLTDARDAAKSIVDRNCPNKSLTECYSRNHGIFERDIAPVKKGTMAQEMFGSLAGVNTGDWFKPDWKLLIRSIANSGTRFAIAPIKKDLNFISRWKHNNEDTSAAIASLRENLTAVKAKIPESETALRADFELRESVVHAVTAFSRKVPVVDFDVIARRVKAFERVAEGVVRAHQSSIQLDAADVNKAIKAHLMSVQMFVLTGFKDANIKPFATLAVPSGITLTTISDGAETVDVPAAPEAPVISAPAAPLAEKKLVIEVKRSDSTSSTASTDPTSSVGSASENTKVPEKSNNWSISRLLGF